MKPNFSFLLLCWSVSWWFRGPRSWLWCYCAPAQGPTFGSGPGVPSYSRCRDPGTADADTFEKKMAAFISCTQGSYLYKIVFIFYSLTTNLIENNDDYDSLAGAPSAGQFTLWHYFRISVLFCIVYSVKLKFAMFLLECHREAFILVDCMSTIQITTQ